MHEQAHRCCWARGTWVWSTVTRFSAAVMMMSRGKDMEVCVVFVAGNGCCRNT
jgi:hypothetical protein